MRAILMVSVVLAVAGCGAKTGSDELVRLEMRIAEETPGEGLTRLDMTGPDKTETFYLHDEVVLDNTDVKSASMVFWNGRPAVELLFTDAGGDKLARATGDNVGRRMAMVLDGKLQVAPVIRDRIPSGRAVINGEFTEEEARLIAERIAPRSEGRR